MRARCCTFRRWQLRFPARWGRATSQALQWGAVGGGNLFQANQAFQQVVNVTGGKASRLANKGWPFGLVMALIDGIKSTAAVMEKIVPFMALLCLAASFVIIGVIGVRFDEVGWAFGQIVDGVFTATGVSGDVVDVSIQSFKRAAVSNEAGIGPGAIARSAVEDQRADHGRLRVAAETLHRHRLDLNDDRAGLHNQQTALDRAHRRRADVRRILLIPTRARHRGAAVRVLDHVSWSCDGLEAWTYRVGEGKATGLIFKFFY